MKNMKPKNKTIATLETVNCPKIITFTKASIHDGYRVTVNLSQLAGAFNVGPLVKGCDLLFLIADKSCGRDGYAPVIFKVNRLNCSTASTFAWPFERPGVSLPVVKTVIVVMHATVFP